MGLFDKFKKKSVEPVEAKRAKSLSQISYETAYLILPRLLYSDADRLIGYFTQTELPAGPYIFAMGCTILKIDKIWEEALEFRAHTGILYPGIEYYILQYPQPPVAAVDITVPGAVLAPYFSAILRDTADDSVTYYILGQRPFGGTTLRTVTPDGTNGNLGEGPQPTLDAFLQKLRDHKDFTMHAALRHATRNSPEET